MPEVSVCFWETCITGDFAVVRNQHLLAEPAAITHKQLIAALMAEAGHKQGGNRGIGFLREIHQ